MNVNLSEIMFGSILMCDDDGEKSERGTERLMNCSERKTEGFIEKSSIPTKEGPTARKSAVKLTKLNFSSFKTPESVKQPSRKMNEIEREPERLEEIRRSGILPFSIFTDQLISSTSCKRRVSSEK